MKRLRSEHRLLRIGIGLAALFWIIEAALDSFVFREGDLIERLFTPDLNELWMRLLVVSLILFFTIYVQVNAKRKQVEQALHESQERLRGILNTTSDAIVSVDEGQHIVFFNHGAETTFGYHPEEVMGKPLDVLLPARFVEAHRKHLEDFAGSPNVARLIGAGEPITGRRKDGSEFPAEASVSKVELRGKQQLLTALCATSASGCGRRRHCGSPRRRLEPCFSPRPTPCLQ